jgi:hypothetical protein
MAPCDRNLHDKPIVVKDSIYHKFYKYINEVKVYEQPQNWTAAHVFGII